MWKIITDTGFKPAPQTTYKSAKLLASTNCGGWVWHTDFPFIAFRANCSCGTCERYHISDCKTNLSCMKCHVDKTA